MQKPRNKEIVLVTGGSGKIGRSLVAKLVSLNYEVRVLSRQGGEVNNKGVKYYQGDITDRGVVAEAMAGCRVVYHLAARQGATGQMESERVNVEGTKLILDLAEPLGVKMLIYCSTVMVFEDTGGCIRDELWHTRKPTTGNAYVDTKIKALTVVRNYRGSVRIVVVYPSIVVAKEDFGGWGGFPGAIMSLMGRADRMMNVVWLKDVVDGLVKIISHRESDNFILGGQNIEVGRYRQLMCRKFKRINLPFRISNFFLKLVGIGPPVEMFFSSDKAKEILGYKPKMII